MSQNDGVSSQSRFWVPLSERLRILTEYKRVAMVGLSANPFRPSHFVAIYLISKGFEVIPVNPREKTILGRTCYASLKEIPGPVDIVDVFRDPSAVPAIVDEAIEIGAKVLWLQLGVIHEAAADRAREAGMTVVMDRCMKIEHGRLFGGLQTIGLNTGIVSSRRIS
jgi:predicted CoA-binding protein